MAQSSWVPASRGWENDAVGGHMYLIRESRVAWLVSETYIPSFPAKCSISGKLLEIGLHFQTKEAISDDRTCLSREIGHCHMSTIYSI